MIQPYPYKMPVGIVCPANQSGARLKKGLDANRKRQLGGKYSEEKNGQCPGRTQV
jgi:hypothetical protein